MIRNLFTTIIITLVVCASCTNNKVYDHYEHTSVDGWDKGEVLVYDVHALRDSGRYVTDLGLRINGDYPFQNLTLIVEQTILPSQTTYKDTINCALFDKNGTILGQGIDNYQYHYRVSEMILQSDDSLHITVRHDMRREIIPGITDVGIALSKP